MTTLLKLYLYLLLFSVLYVIINIFLLWNLFVYTYIYSLNGKFEYEKGKVLKDQNYLVLNRAEQF